jgi:2-methylcitrate dehydratase PrpD
MGYTSTLAEFAAGTGYEAIPRAVLEKGKRLILDTLGNAVAGFSTSGGKLALKTKQRLGGTPESTVLVTGHRTSSTHAAFCNATLASALEADDTCLQLGHHGQCSFMPALALAESTGASGRDFLAAAVIAYETGARIASAARHVVRGADGELKFNPSGGGVNWVVFPAVVGAARMLRLDASRMASAFGIAGFSSTIPTGGRWNHPPRSHLKYNPYAFMAESGTLAALLSAEGFTGDPDIFDGDVREVKANWWQMSGCIGVAPESAVGGLGERWITLEASLKPYPSCRFTHGPLGLFEGICAAHDLAAADIEHVDVYSNQMMFAYHMDSAVVGSEADCQFSMPHLIAMAALKIPAGPRWVSPEFWRDPAVESLKSRVECHRYELGDQKMVEQLLAGRWEKTHSAVRVRTRDGETFESKSEHAPGDPFTPATAMSDEALIAKFRRSTELGLAEAQISRCIERVMELESQPDVRGLIDLLH